MPDPGPVKNLERKGLIMSKGAPNVSIIELAPGLPAAHRFTHFPPTSIFGKTLVPIYYCQALPIIPLVYVARAIGVPFNTAFAIVAKQREAFDTYDAATCAPVPPAASLQPLCKTLCLGMEGICTLLFALDHSRIKDPAVRERIITAKRWLACQVSNRIKFTGRRNQTRWDSGLSKEQADNMKKRFASMNGSQ